MTGRIEVYTSLYYKITDCVICPGIQTLKELDLMKDNIIRKRLKVDDYFYVTLFTESLSLACDRRSFVWLYENDSIIYEV